MLNHILSFISNKYLNIDEQMCELRKMVIESGSFKEPEKTRAAARAWMVEAKKLEKKWPKTAPSVLDITKKDRRHHE